MGNKNGYLAEMPDQKFFMFFSQIVTKLKFVNLVKNLRKIKYKQTFNCFLNLCFVVLSIRLTASEYVMRGNFSVFIET